MTGALGRARYVFLSALAGVILYCNVALLANQVCAGLTLACRLPIGFLIGGLFNVFPVFRSYATENTEMLVLGLPRGADANDEEQWRALDVNEYFPYRLGEQHARILANAHRYVGSDRQQEAWDFVGGKIRDRYNRSHPDAPLEKIRMRTLHWPRSTDGYYARKQVLSTTITDLYTGP